MNIENLKSEQMTIAKQVVLKDDFKINDVTTFGGVDTVAFSNKLVAAAVVCSIDLNAVEKKWAAGASTLPYMPGFLFYREGQVSMEAVNNLEKKPDVLLVDANGVLHPLKAGMASHIGVLLDIPTIGVAKSLMCGKVIDGKIILNNEILGEEVRTREFSNPLYVSPGHKISLESAVQIVKKCIKYPHKLPEPLHLAHREADRAKDMLMKRQPTN